MVPEPRAASGPAVAGGDAGAPPVLSVVIPVRNEAPNIAPLVAEIEAALAAVAHEIVYVDDGSTDDTPAALRAVCEAGAPVRAIRHRSSCGQSAAIVTGVKAARGRWIATLDGDGQNDPADIPRLLARAGAEAEAGRRTLVAGHRVNRRDSGVKRYSSRIANAVRSRLLRDATPDTGCGLKVFPRDLFLDLPHFDHMHRFLPALTLRQGGAVVSEPVNHRPRVRGVSNYGTLDRLMVSLFDLVGMAWLQRRGRRPVIESDQAS
ncbi:glycosyltransferase [Neoroseomonas lacus]|uniref:Dolichol-phosphate mannosyltransferase n=1 Tax=Neoroseomonas lacus TaxID=287609 RepID=A0A917KF52_9PROT|nr:glycosyltransferase [Neoroseomonas lacus]GGJ11203.1 dolichol-phosphate mannosyltransferase [Neoroseomonas lacus]